MNVQRIAAEKFKKAIDNLSEDQIAILQKFTDPYGMRAPGMLRDYFLFYNKDVRTSLNMGNEDFYRELSTLYGLGFLTDNQASDWNPEPYFNGNIPIENYNRERYSGFMNEEGLTRITDIGNYAIQHINKVEQLKLMEKIKELEEIKMPKFEGKVDSFYSHILVILGLIASIFSIIGINLNTIPNLNTISPFAFLGTVIIINISLVVSIFAFLGFYNKFILDKKNKCSLFMVLTIIAALVVAFLMILFGSK